MLPPEANFKLHIRVIPRYGIFVGLRRLRALLLFQSLGERGANSQQLVKVWFRTAAGRLMSAPVVIKSTLKVLGVAYHSV